MFSKEKLEELRALKARKAAEAAAASAGLRDAAAAGPSGSAPPASAALPAALPAALAGASRSELAAEKEKVKAELQAGLPTLTPERATALKTRLRALSTRLAEPLTAEEAAAERASLARESAAASALRAGQELRLRELFRQLEAAQRVDLLFMIDCTASMEPFVAQAHAAVERIIARVRCTSPKLQLRLSFVGYRDFDLRGVSEVSVLDFTEDVGAFQTAMRAARCVQNNDPCEDVASGLRAATRLTWRNPSRLLYHITDAPSHGTAYHGYGARSPFDLHTDHPSVLEIPRLLNELHGLGVAYFFAAAELECTATMVAAFNAHVPQKRPFVTVMPLKHAQMLTNQAVEAVRSTINTSTCVLRDAAMRTVALDNSGACAVLVEDVAAQLAALRFGSEVTNTAYAACSTALIDWNTLPARRVRDASCVQCVWRA
jgi:hypothetical protein